MSVQVRAESVTAESSTGVEDRSILATRRLCQALGLGTLKPKDLKHLTVALAEVAADEAASRPPFADKVLAIYQDLSRTKTPAPSNSRTSGKRAVTAKFTPIRAVDPKLFGPDKPLDPYLLLYAYGDEQFRPMLQTFPPAELKKAVTIVEERNPGTKPKNKSAKLSLIDYIVQYVTDGHV